MLTFVPDPAISTVESPVDANVWKVLVSEGQDVSPGTTIAILEAMKLEINVNAPEDQRPAKVEKVLVKAGVCSFPVLSSSPFWCMFKGTAKANECV